jgi:hypothetical protein
MSIENNTDDKKIAARKEAWRRGLLSFKLDTTQKELYDLFYNSTHKIMTWLLSRRQGKTYTLCILALEQCIRQPHSIVKFVSPTKTQITQIVRPIFRQILEDCPEDVKPEFRHKDYIYYFPNGSEIQLAGTDSGHAEKLRGGDSHIWFIDEAGSCDDLNNVIKSILLPTTLITKGKGVLASTPPKESEHEFLHWIEDAQLKGSFIKKTIDDNPRITKEQKEELIQEVGGINSEECRRELYCEIIKDSTTAVIPEFDFALEQEISKEWPKPPFYDAYEAMDTGGKDLTVVLYGYYDFRADKIIIEDETVMNFQDKNTTIELLTKEINKKEIELWKNPLSLEYKSPYFRFSDIDYILIQEIYAQSRKLFPREQVIQFNIAKKDDLDTAINNLRIMLANKKIIINPKCTTLLRHLKNVKWDKQKKKFARSQDNGHYDAVAALVYFVRNVQYTKNPYPQHYQLNMQTLPIYLQDPSSFANPINSQVEVFKRIFNVKSKRKF